MSESLEEYSLRLDRLIEEGKLQAKYKATLLEIAEVGYKACELRLICGLGWGEDTKGNVLDEYEILDNNGNFLYMTLVETRDYLQKLIVENEN